MSVVPYYLADAADSRLVLPDGETRIVLYYLPFYKESEVMKVFARGELDRLQETQESAMQDTCTIQTYSSMTDGYGNPKPVYRDAYESECGAEHLDPAEVQATGQVPVIDTKLRMPFDTELDVRDRIKITHRFGVELDTPQIFEIAGPPERGPSGLMFSLRIVDDE